MILTNKLKVKINTDSIAEDFDIFMVTKDSAKLDGTNILDISENEFKALAVQYSFGRRALVLFKKGSVDERRFRNRLNEEFEDVSVYHITLDDLNDQKFCEAIFYACNRLLVQLMFNSMMNYKSDSFAYNNLTGKLFYTKTDKIKKNKKSGEVYAFSYLEAKLDPGMYLNLDTKTFRQDNTDKKGRRYVLDKKTGKLRKKLKTDRPDEKTYIEGAFKDKHTTFDYLGISSYSEFQESKLGIMLRFLNDVEKKLGKYLEVKTTEIEDGYAYEISKKEKKGLTNKDIGKHLNKRGVVIIDENQTQRSHEITERLKSELITYYGVNAEVGNLSAYRYNIRIIHNPEYYEEREIDDPHNINLDGYIVQHLNEEVEHFNNKKQASPAVNKIVQELIIKGDVLDRKISVFDWNKLGAEKEWTFITRNKLKTALGTKNEPHENFAGVKTYDNYAYKVLKVKPDGELDYSTFDDMSENLTEFEEKICFDFDEYHKKYWGGGNTVEGLVFSDINNIHAIILTPEKTIPNLKAIAGGLKETDGTKTVSRDVICEGIDSYIETAYMSRAEKATLEGVKTELKQGADVVTLSALRKTLGMKKKVSKGFNRYLHENYNIWISAEMKDQFFEEYYALESILDIKYFQQPDYEGTPSFYYYVGTKRGSLQGSMHNACAVRKVVSDTGNIEFSELLPLMAVDFVRNKQYTVLPFPFKYLREWNTK